MKKYNIVQEAWAPFAEGRQDTFTNEVLREIGRKYGKTIEEIVKNTISMRYIIISI